MSSPRRRFNRPSRAQTMDPSPQVAPTPLPRVQSPRRRATSPLPRIEEHVTLPVPNIANVSPQITSQKIASSTSDEVVQGTSGTPSPRHEVTLWTLLVITSFGYFCFFLLFVVCILVGLRRLVFKLITVVAWMGSKIGDSDAMTSLQGMLEVYYLCK